MTHVIPLPDKRTNILGEPLRFRGAFAKYACVGDELHVETDGFHIHARLVRDDSIDRPDQRDDGFWPSIDPEATGYIGSTDKKELAKAKQHADAVMDAWQKDEWFYCGIVLRVEYKGVLLNDFAASLYGIECNYPKHPHAASRAEDFPNAYLTEVANELLDEALETGKEELKLRRIIITVEGGVIQGIDNIPEGTIVEVRDFDTEGTTQASLETNSNGQHYIKSVWEKI